MDEAEYIQQSLLQEGSSSRTAVSVAKKKVEKHQSSLESLPDGVLSFLLSSFLGLSDAVHASLSLAATCTDLRRRMREIVGPSMQVKADLRHLKTQVGQYTMLLKLSTARIGLEELQLKVGRSDLCLLASLMEEGFLECRTMLKLGITKSVDPNYMFPIEYLRAYMFPTSYFLPLRELRFPMSRHLEELLMGSSSLVDYDTESLISVLVRECKQLQSLEFFIWVDTGELTTAERSLSEELPNLQQLAVTLCNSKRNFRLNAIEKLDRLVTSIPNLKDLKLCAHNFGFSLPLAYFRLRSDTLETVNVIDSGKRLVFFDSVACPKLKLFRCRGRGGGYGNGVRPWDPGTHGDSRDGEFFGYTSQCSRYTIAEQSFYGMQVPDDCVVEFQHDTNIGEVEKFWGKVWSRGRRVDMDRTIT
jgi:hypothetical protein